jgi:hypothetical protein
VCAAGLGDGHALRLVRLAARQLTAVSTTGSGCIGSIMRAPSHAIDHHRNRPALEPILHRATKRGCFCEMLVAATTDPRRAALARMTLLIRWPEVPCTSEKGSNRPCTSSLARISDTAQSVRASDTSNCRYRHPPAPWLQNPASPLQHFYGHFIIDLFKKNDGYGTSS